MGARVTLRNRAEAALRAWNAYEVGRGAPAVIDFDCYPEGAAGEQPASSRLAVHEELEAICAAARNAGLVELAERVGAGLAYLDALLGVRPPLDDYVRATQGCGTGGLAEGLTPKEAALAAPPTRPTRRAWGPGTTT